MSGCVSSSISLLILRLDLESLQLLSIDLASGISMQYFKGLPNYPDVYLLMYVFSIEVFVNEGLRL